MKNRISSILLSLILLTLFLSACADNSSSKFKDILSVVGQSDQVLVSTLGEGEADYMDEAKTEVASRSYNEKLFGTDALVFVLVEQDKVIEVAIYIDDGNVKDIGRKITGEIGNPVNTKTTDDGVTTVLYSTDKVNVTLSNEVNIKISIKAKN